MIRLTYQSREELKRCLQDPVRRVLFHPDLLDVQVGEIADIEIGFKDSDIRFPMLAMVSARRVAQKGSVFPQGLYYEISQKDSQRYRRLHSFAYDTWRPRIGRQKRYRVVLTVSYRYSYSTHRARTRDISAQGLFVRSDHPLPEEGQDVLVRLRPSWFSWPVNLEARVCWLDQVDSRRGMGLSCSNTDGLKRLAALAKKLQNQAEPGKAA